MVGLDRATPRRGGGRLSPTLLARRQCLRGTP